MRLLVAARILTILGVALALAGLLGHRLVPDEPKTALTSGQRQLLGAEEDEDPLGFVIAGRDVLYASGESRPVYGDDGTIVCWRYSGIRSAYGTNTDTIIYAALIGQELTMILLPRDLFVNASGTGRINGVYGREGADALRMRVGEVLGLPVDYHAVINLDIFQRLVDALGGVEIEVPVRMYHRDCAADLTIDLRPGLQRLDGVQASHFVRYRSLPRGDIDRLDNVKTLAYALLQRVKELHVRAVGRLPELLDSYYDEVDTNAGLGTLTRLLLTRGGDLTIRSAGTLPTVEVTRNGTLGLETDARAVEEYLAGVFGGSARPVLEAPEGTVLITNRSGSEGLAQAYRRRLAVMGVPEERIATREAAGDDLPTRVIATLDGWTEADYYANLLAVGKHQVERFNGARGGARFEIVLGGDAREWTEGAGEEASTGMAN